MEAVAEIVAPKKRGPKPKVKVDLGVNRLPFNPPTLSAEKNAGYLQDMVIAQQIEMKVLGEKVSRLQQSLINLVNVLRPQVRGIMDRFQL